MRKEKVAAVSGKESGKKAREEGGGGKRRKVEADVLVLGSSDVECKAGGERQGGEAGEGGEGSSDGELDEWGMPPSGQGR